MSSRRSFVFFSLLLTSACAYRTPAVHAPSELPGFEVTDVTVFDHVGAGGDEKVKERTRDLLAHAAKPGAARASVRVSIADREDNIYSRSLSQDGCAVMGMVGVPAGQVIDRESVVVDVSIVSPTARRIADGQSPRSTGACTPPHRSARSRRRSTRRLPTLLRSRGAVGLLP